MDELHYQNFLKKFPEQAYALSKWKHKAAVFHNGPDAARIAQEFFNYLAALPSEHELSYFGHTVRAVPFAIEIKSVAAGDSLDSLVQEVEHHQGNGQPHFLYLLIDPENALNYNQRENKDIYTIDITACLDLWNSQEKNKK